MGITAGHAMELLERPGEVVVANDGEAVHFITEIDGELVLNTWIPSISERRSVVIDRDNARGLIVRAGSRDGNTLRREPVDETPFGDSDA